MYNLRFHAIIYEVSYNKGRNSSVPSFHLIRFIMIKFYKIITASFLTCLMITSISISAYSQDQNNAGGVFDIPTSSDNKSETVKEENISVTHPTLNLTPDKSELVKLDKEAASVIVGNPNHINVMLDTPNTIIVVPRAPGASYFTVIGKDGSIIMQRHAVVSGGENKKDYIRIRRSCGNNTSGRPCETTSVYFCPDMCHEVSLK